MQPRGIQTSRAVCKVMRGTRGCMETLFAPHPPPRDCPRKSQASNASLRIAALGLHAMSRFVCVALLHPAHPPAVPSLLSPVPRHLQVSSFFPPHPPRPRPRSPPFPLRPSPTPPRASAEMPDAHASDIIAGETLAPISDLQDYGATIIAELDKAEKELDASINQPFNGMTADVMRDMAALRERQFEMFRRHVEIEQAYKIENSVADGNDVQRMSFSGIAKTMRKKESATAGLLDKLANFDQQLRLVVDKFETHPNTKSDAQPTRPSPV